MTTSMRRQGPTMVAQIAFAMVLLLGLAAVASGVAAAVVASDDHVVDQVSQADQETVSPGNAIAQVNETTSDTEDTATNGTDTELNESEDDIPLGARLASVIGTQASEHRSAVASRAYEKAFENAISNASRAAVVADQTTQIEEQLRDLERERDRLEDRYDAGNVSNGTYRARMTVIEARLRGLEYRANRTTVRGTSLPAPALERANVSEHRLRSLENRTANAGVPESATIPSTVRGTPPGVPRGPSRTGAGNAHGGPPVTTGPPADGPTNTSDDRSGHQNETRGSGVQNTGSVRGNGSEQPNGMFRSQDEDTHPREEVPGKEGAGGQWTPSSERRHPSMDHSQVGSAATNGSAGPGNGGGSVFGNFGAVKVLLGYLR